MQATAPGNRIQKWTKTQALRKLPDCWREDRKEDPWTENTTIRARRRGTLAVPRTSAARHTEGAPGAGGGHSARVKESRAPGLVRGQRALQAPQETSTGERSAPDQGPGPQPHPEAPPRRDRARRQSPGARGAQPAPRPLPARPHRPRPWPPTRTRRLAGTTRRPPGPRAHRHRRATLPAAAPATTSFRAKTGSRDPPEPGKRLKEHGVVTSASTACAGGGPEGGPAHAPEAARLPRLPASVLGASTSNDVGAGAAGGGQRGPAPPAACVTLGPRGRFTDGAAEAQSPVS